MQNKKVGVVIPIYNVAEYLRECLDSVINQTYKNLSIVLVNDGSTDNNESLNIAKEYVAKDSRFILIDKENGGQSTARNVGIAWFSEKYEAKLDSSINLESSTTYTIDSTLQYKDKVKPDLKATCHTEPLSEVSNMESNFYLDSEIDSNKDFSPMTKNNKNLNSTQNTNYNNRINSNNGGGGVTLYSYNITNENPYNIYKIYASNTTNNHNSTLQPQKIDYIIFLDSDDYWKPYCIEECIKHSDGVDIVWFDYEVDCGEIEASPITQLHALKIPQQKINMQDWLYRLYDKQQIYFSWVWQGIINFKFLKHIDLYFYDKVFAEDHLFGTLLFLQSEFIYVIPKPFYVYRIRSNSSCDFDPDHIYIPRHFEQYCDIFDNRLITKEYYIASSWLFMFLAFMKFLEDNQKVNDEILQNLFSLYIQHSLKLFDFKHDPLNLIPKLPAIEPYLKKGFKYRHKLRITNPKKYNRLKLLFAGYDFIKSVERNIRKIFKLHNKACQNKQR
ncbi:hypothetical protein XJ32_04420 [Helicobacter bilis]|uniref:Glycosyltransferase 2-like domain-containing protein n=1 Tax=Helicobacter bilis TaxID=37372 RepID=A0A1Q2LHL4_9HELI|nr:hypothetical protein XJ32_04420 [Helicobacter bilis]